MSECPNCQRLQAIIESRDRDLDAQDVGIGYEVLQRREAKAYLTRLLAQYDPTCVPMDGLIGLCTQIDNAIERLEAENAAFTIAADVWAKQRPVFHREMARLIRQRDTLEAENAALRSDRSQLGELVEQWKRYARPADDAYSNGCATAFGECADALDGAATKPISMFSPHNVPAEHAMIGATLDALAAGISVEALRAAVEESKNDPGNMVG